MPQFLSLWPVISMNKKKHGHYRSSTRQMFIRYKSIVMGSKTWFEEGETASANAGIDPFEDRLISSLHASKLYSKENNKKKPQWNLLVELV